MRLLGSLGAGLAIVLMTTLPVRGAAPQRERLLGNIDFLDSSHGWVEVSTSPGYTQACQTSTQPPATCNTARTSLFLTSNGGHTWSRRLTFTGPPLTSYGELPQTWMHVFSPSTVLMLSIASTVHGGTKSQLYATFNRGRGWKSHPVPGQRAYVSPTDIAFVDARHLWLLRHQGAASGSEMVNVLRTSDAGTHWKQIACTSVPGATTDCHQKSGIAFSGHKGDVVFSSLSHGWMAESDASGVPSLYVSNDGGSHWALTHPGLPRGFPTPNSRKKRFPFAVYQQPISFGQFVILPSVARICSPTSGTSSCRGGLYALLSTDGGRTWPVTRHVPSNTNASPPAPWQVMTSRIWWSVRGTQLWRTDDTGRHWHAVTMHLPTGLKLLQIQMISQTTGWGLAGSLKSQSSYATGTSLLKTTDAGAHWSTVKMP